MDSLGKIQDIIVLLVGRSDSVVGHESKSMVESRSAVLMPGLLLQIFIFVIAIFCAMGSALFVVLLYKIWCAPRSAFETAHILTGSLRRAVRGRIGIYESLPSQTNKAPPISVQFFTKIEDEHLLEKFNLRLSDDSDDSTEFYTSPENLFYISEENKNDVDQHEGYFMDKSRPAAESRNMAQSSNITYGLASEPTGKIRLQGRLSSSLIRRLLG